MNEHHRDEGSANDPPVSSREAWLLMSDLVLAQGRRRDVAESLGLSFSKTRALRQLARQPMSMGELASALGIEPANTTGLVDDLEFRELVRRRPHPTDRRAKIVEATRKGKAMARRADEILSTPPPELEALDPEDLAVMVSILRKATRLAD